MMKTANSTTTQVQQHTDTGNHAAVQPVKMERRGSETSESSLEQLDLGRTPKKLSTLSSATSTPHISNSTSDSNSHSAVLANPVAAAVITEHANRTAIETGTKPARHSLHHHDSDEANDYDEDDSADEKRSSARSHRHYHHKRRSSGRMDKHSVQLEINAENPNSLRKKFRFNRSVADINSLTTNESGFVDASTSSSQLLNASAASGAHAQQPHPSPETCATGSQSSSSASSSPHGAGASASSPESGIGERDDMKFVCPICEVVSATPHEFTNHIRCHNYTSGDTENFTCRICSKVLSSASSLDRHVLVHTGERPFNCKYCHLTFTTNGNMHRHMRTHKQHQHNHHHRRNSNGTAATAVKNTNNNTSTTAAGTPQTTPPAVSSTQLTNGSSNVEGVKASPTKPTAPTTTAAINGAHVNGSLLNGAVVESYDSDGGCSTDSSSAISDNSKNPNNNNNNIKTSNYNNNVNNCKRKNIDNLDADITLLKRRVKTTINNNIISDDNQMETTSGAIDDLQLPAATHHRHHHQAHLFACPVCNASDFDSMLMLSAHMDSEHCDIPAKCRHCDVVYHTHRQLNVHPCTSKLTKTPPRPKEPTYGEFINEKSPPLVDHSLHTSAMGQMFECPKCSCTFAGANDLDMHVRECRRQSVHRIYHYAEDDLDEHDLPQRAFKKRVLSESSAGLDDAEAEEEDEEEQQQQQHNREEFFKRLYLKHKANMHAQNMLSPQHSVDENMDDIKFEADCEKMAQQSHDSKDLADIQSILNMTSSSSTSNFLKNFEHTVNTPSSNYGMDKDEEEAQDAFTSDFRKMKLRGEFPCKLCTAVFPNLRALKGHNRIHLSAAGPSGPFRCNMCPYSICDKAALVRHMRSHNGDRPYECAVCNYAFTTKANCERHLRNRHAKTSRDEVKRAIIYHPSEDSSCDDPTKKLHMFSSPEIDDDVDLQYQHHQPKDRSTPVSHLKEILTCEDGRSSKAIKIQVKSIEQLLDKTPASSSYNEVFNEEERTTKATQHPTDSNQSPIDLSMDVLDLSKKPAKLSVPKEQPPAPLPTPTIAPEAINTMTPAPLTDNPKFDITILEKNQQYLLAQQQLINEALPKIVDPTHYFQQLYRNLVFPPMNPINPFFLHNSFLPNNLSDLQKYAPLMSRMFGSSPSSPMAADAMKTHPANSNSIPTPAMVPQASPLLSEKSSVSSMNSSPISTNSMHPKTVVTPTSSQAISIPRHPNMQSTTLAGGPVKMVIKNGVLMPKQKQRRYRTERPFACDHCSARFTLRSNMERHVKQQHPQFYAQRQRSGHHIMRGRGASSAAAMNSITHLQAAIAAHNGSGAHVGPTSISEQVKYAILAQQLKARKDTDLLHQALAHGSSSVAPTHLTLGPPVGSLAQAPKDLHLNLNHLNNSSVNGSLEEEDDPKLIIDEDDEELLDDNDEEQYQEDEEDFNESLNDLDLVNDSPKTQTGTNEPAIKSAKKVAETILEQAIKAGGNSNYNSNQKSNLNASPQPAKTMKTMIAQAESVGKFLKEVASSPFKDESQDLVPVAKLVDNATTNAMSFNNYFRPSDVANHMEQSDEEGLVASGSASESNNSGTEDMSSSTEPKKKSAYSLAPNRVSCPYCQRMFPWSSSLRRHILTHTGQKPFKCSHCPLLFTTKSNCDRHLLRKHGNIESAVSVYVPTEDVNEPIPVPKSVEEIEQQQRQREEERKRKSEEAARMEKERKEKEEREQEEQEQKELLKQIAAAQFNQSTAQSACAGNNLKSDSNAATAAAYSELPFKCHLCDSSFGERFQCLDHIKIQHAHEFSLLLAKGAIDTDPEHNQVHSTEDEECRRPGEDSNGRCGKYPDYSNRKVICAFCVRRFWSTEDLRRHMRTHSGERPFQCDICLRKFTLKHSMLRHMKKHNGRHHSAGTGEHSNATNSGSDLSDDEQMSPTTPTNAIVMANTLAMRTHKIQELLSKANEWRTNRMSLGEHKENIAEEHNTQTDLIGNLLGISDQGILNKLLSSADEAAKLLGVEK